MQPRSTAWIVAGLGAALVLLPLGLGLPGFPMHLRADETSHYLLARSLAADGDTLVDARDLDRLFRDMPHARQARFVVGSDDGWQTARWAVAPLYALVVAPAAALARTNGVFAVNALCFVLTLWLLGGRLAGLRREDDRSLGWVLAGAALFLSASFVYVWWIHPASLRLLLVAAAMCFGWQRGGRATPQAAAAGACLGLCVGEVPWTLVLLPALLARRRTSLRSLGALAAGVVGGAAVALFAGWLALGHAGTYGFAERAAFTVESPDAAPWATGEVREAEGLRASDGAGTGLGLHARRLLLSLVDRRRGLFVLFPFAALFLALALRRRSHAAAALRPDPAARDSGSQLGQPEPWEPEEAAPEADAPARALLAAGLLALVASRAFTAPEAVDLERYGDPVLATVWPAFFFLPAAVPGALAILGACAISALLLLPAVLTPFLPPVAFGGAHHAERSALVSRLPTGLEEVSEAGGFEVHEVGDASSETWRLWLPDHATKRIARDFAVLGGERVQIWVESDAPRSALHLDIRSFAPGNRVVIESSAGGERFTFPGAEPPEATRARIPLDGAWRRVTTSRGTAWAAPMVVSTSTGESPDWRTPIADLYYTGLRVTVLGSDEHLQRPVWGAEWGACGAPPTAAPGETLRVLARLRNVSATTWPVDGSVRVRLGTRWRSATDRESSLGDGRADFRDSVEPGEEVLTWVETEAPEAPGTWRLEIEPVYELVGWFSDHAENPASAVCTTDVEVVSNR